MSLSSIDQKILMTSQGGSAKQRRRTNQVKDNNRSPILHSASKFLAFLQVLWLTYKLQQGGGWEGSSRLSGFLPKLCFACDSQSGQRHIATCDRSRINESSVKRQFVSQGLANIARRRVGQMPDRAKASQFVQLR